MTGTRPTGGASTAVPGSHMMTSKLSCKVAQGLCQPMPLMLCQGEMSWPATDTTERKHARETAISTSACRHIKSVHRITFTYVCACRHDTV